MFLQKYDVGGFYLPHYDYIFKDKMQSIVGNRLATLFLIIQKAKKGGETIFVEKNLSIAPKSGGALFWINTIPQGTLDTNSFHGACPIKEGTKIGITFWIRTFGNEFIFPCSKKTNKTYHLDNIM